MFNPSISVRRSLNASVSAKWNPVSRNRTGMSGRNWTARCRRTVPSAFQAEGTVLLHLAVQFRPDVPVLFLETGFHFAETLAFKERLTEMLGLNMVELTGDYTVEGQEEAYGPQLYER